MSNQPIIFDIQYTPYRLKKTATAKEQAAHAEARSFYDMTGTKNVYRYITTEGKRAGQGGNALDYLQKNTGIFNGNGMLTEEEVDEMRARDHSPEELCFYSKATTDIEFLFPFGWGELWGIADRTDYDLTQHQNVSGQDMSYFDDESKEKYIPYVIEPSLGADRVTLAFLCSAYDEEEIGEGDVRTVLHFHPAIAPVKVGVLPLSKKLNAGAEKIYQELSKYFNCEFDDRGNIGKRYRRQDEIGTPFCITYDFESETDQAVTVRDRDTMEQVRVPIAELRNYFQDKFAF